VKPTDSRKDRPFPLFLPARSRHRRLGMVLCLFLLALLLMPASVAFSQYKEQAVDFEDLGFYDRLFTAARPAALAGAYTSIGDDVHALVYNPAGLARVRRIDGSLGFQYEKNGRRNVFYGSPADVDQTSINLDYLSVAFPFPTYRGSLVGAVGVYREYSSYLDLLYRGLNTDTDTKDDYILQQTGSVFSYNFGFGVDLSPTLSVGASFFILDATIDALTQYSYEFIGPVPSGQTQQYFLLDDLETDLDGYGGRLGVQFNPRPDLQFGAALTTPVWINLAGSAYQEETFYQAAAPDSFSSGDVSVKIDYRLPFHLDGGFSYRHRYLLLSLDIGYTDWTQSSVKKTRLRDINLRPVQREVVDVRFGLELSLPNLPVHLRGGYAYLPYPLPFLIADRIEGEPLVKANVNREQQLFSVGLGGLIGRVMSLDLAYQYRNGRRSIPTLSDEQSLHRLLISTSYYF
jgi:hypothetical protein